MLPTSAWAGTTINTIGSADGIAIGGFDTVAFFLQKKAVRGSVEFAYEWSGAKWYFSSAENITLFKGNPEKWAPQYGGHCSLGTAEGYLSSKPTSGLFEIVNDKLYLFPHGNRSETGAVYEWLNWGGGPIRRIENGDRNWPQLKSTLEAK
jgi:YHS domain-containing protein